MDEGGYRMGLFGKSNKNILNDALKNAKTITKMVECPKCHSRMTVTFMSKNDFVTCKKCGSKIWCEKL